jgi:hypothetical protein
MCCQVSVCFSLAGAISMRACFSRARVFFTRSCVFTHARFFHARVHFLSGGKSFTCARVLHARVPFSSARAFFTGTCLFQVIVHFSRASAFFHLLVDFFACVLHVYISLVLAFFKRARFTSCVFHLLCFLRRVQAHLFVFLRACVFHARVSFPPARALFT